MDEKELEYKEMDIIFEDSINENTLLLGNVQLETFFNGVLTKNKLNHILKVFIVGKNGKFRLEKVYDKPSSISSLIEWCKHGEASMYDDLFYIPNREDRKALLLFIMDFLHINKACFDAMEYNEYRKEYVDILKGL